MIHLRLCILLDDPVSLFDFADELVLPSCNLGEIVIGELAPCRFDASRKLKPLAFDLFPIHDVVLRFLESAVGPR